MEVVISTGHSGYMYNALTLSAPHIIVTGVGTLVHIKSLAILCQSFDRNVESKSLLTAYTCTFHFPGDSNHISY